MVVVGFTDSSDWLLWGLLIVQFRLVVVGFTDCSDGCCGVY